MSDLKTGVQDKEALQSSKEQDTDADLRQRAGDALHSSTEAAREKLKEAADAAKEVASDASDRLQEEARQKQHAGADYVRRIAQNMRNAAHAFEKDTPLTARGINLAAEYVDEAAQKLRGGSLQDVVDGATEFARRQPAAFMGLSVLTGFAVVRFLKASGDASSQRGGPAR
jgi:HD-GYP domain-containing protein (c-di-GMP phosphodiesterase class II)